MFLSEPESTPASQALYDEDLRVDGYVANNTRAWAWLPESVTAIFSLLGEAEAAGNLTFRDKAVLVSSVASGLGDSYCSLAWGSRLAHAADAETAAGVLRGEEPEAMTPREVAMARWARMLASDPNATTQGDVDLLRAAGLEDGEIFATTVYLALRIAFSTVNDAVGARPDADLVVGAPAAVAAAVDFGRTVDAPAGRAEAT